MAVYKDNATGTWRVIYRFTNWKGERKQTQKRGFATKREWADGRGCFGLPESDQFDGKSIGMYKLQAM